MVDNVSAINSGSNASAGIGFGNPPEDIKKKLLALGIPADVITQGRDAVKAYAEQNGISMPQPPKDADKDASLFGEKAKHHGNRGEGIEQKLAALGIPADIIAQGKEAVMQYAQQNNITLPQPPKPPGAGDKLDFPA